jgi:hypothetical protein
MADLGLAFEPAAFPSAAAVAGRHRARRAGARDGLGLRAAAARKVLGSNETQESSLGAGLPLRRRQELPLLDLSDLRALLTFLDSDAGKASSRASAAVEGDGRRLLRALVGSETGAGDELLRRAAARLHRPDARRARRPRRHLVLELPAVAGQAALSRPRSCGCWRSCSRRCRGRRPAQAKLVFFFDEAHLLFDDGPDAFLKSVAQTVRLIRSKGVGVLLRHPDAEGRPGRRARPARQPLCSTRCAPSRPTTPKALKATVSTFPRSEFYDLDELLPRWPSARRP